MVTLFLRQGENGKQVLPSFPATTLTEIADVAATLETLKSMSRTVTIQGAASEVMNLGLYLSGVDHPELPAASARFVQQIRGCTLRRRVHPEIRSRRLHN